MFADRLEAATGTSLPDYAALHQYSIEHPERFWRAVWDDAQVLGHPGDRVMVPAAELYETVFFPDATLNVAQNLLRRQDESPALVWRGEQGASQEMSWNELHQLVSQIQQGLAAAGVDAGDRVAAWLPNRPETYAIMLAAASIGAIFTSTSPDFGGDGVVDRFGQTTPKVLFAIDQAVPNFTNPAVFTTDGQQGRAIGYDGKLCVHPDQVPLANDAYTPSGEQVGQARQLLAGLES